jgi:hypothetical protein
LAGCVPETSLIATEVEFVVVQLSVDDCPVVIAEGLPANERTVGVATGLTTTVVVAVTIPPAPVAVSV